MNLRSLTVGLFVFAAACGGGQLPSPDGATPDHCANVGCAAPPLCSAGCTAVCGCCPCAAGQRNGDLVCTSQGCYEPAPASDGGTDAAHDAPTDAAHDATTDAAHDTATDGANDAPGDGGWTPAPACALPFESGPCDAAFYVYAFVGGSCVPRIYGGCQGNANRFSTFEECMATCVGSPQGGCPPDRIDREICIACGPAGGCLKTARVCALVCTQSPGMSTCPTSLGCFDGVCQVVGCI